MSLKVGDPVFEKTGFPSYVKEREPETESVHLDARKEKVKEQSRHGYIRGLSGEQRSDFNEILDDIADISEPREKAATLQEKIQDIEGSEPTLQNKRMIRYLKSELFHIMQSYKVFPREYQTSEDQLV